MTSWKDLTEPSLTLAWAHLEVLKREGPFLDELPLGCRTETITEATGICSVHFVQFQVEAFGQFLLRDARSGVLRFLLFGGY